MKQIDETTRRRVLGGMGAIGVAGLTSGSVSAGSHDNGNGGPDHDEAEPEPPGFPPEHLTEWGEPEEMGEGEVKTFVTLNSADMPVLLGLHMTADAMDGLGDDFEHITPSFPDTVEETPFEWAGIDWAPEGHGPPNIYTLPHFDIHFYMLPEDEVQEIPPINYPPGEDEDAEPYLEPIAEDQYPPNHIRDHAVVPEMGEHLPDATAPEWNEEEFGNTFVWGHWEGDLIFYEPMITVDYFESMAEGQARSPLHERQETQAIAMPERFSESGRYPTEYTVRYHEGEDAFTVTLEKFMPFDESENGEE